MFRQAKDGFPIINGIFRSLQGIRVSYHTNLSICFTLGRFNTFRAGRIRLFLSDASAEHPKNDN